MSDYEMPQKGGLHFLKELREQKNEIPFIIFTGKRREEVDIHSLNLEADYYVSKYGSPEIIYGELSHDLRASVERTHARSTHILEVHSGLNVLKNSPAVLLLGWIDYGQLVKVKAHGRLMRKERLVVYGVLVVGDIEMTDVENLNGILRERLGRLVCAVELFRFYWNFIKEFERGKSPG